MAAIRLQKIIAQAGLASRREAERMIREGRVRVNGECVRTPGVRADPSADAIKVNGKLLAQKEPPVYLVLHKPRCVLTTMRDEEGKDRPTVADLLPRGLRRVFPVGRLDFDVEGVLLLTNDGEMAHRLAHPRYAIARVYEAKVKGAPSEDALARMADGSWTRGRGRKPQAAQVRILRGRTEKNAWLRIELREGRRHQVKKMCEAVGHPVIKLVRCAYGGVTSRGLGAGRVRTLTQDEVDKLRQITKIRPEAAVRAPSRAGWAKARPNPRRAGRERAAHHKPKGGGKPETPPSKPSKPSPPFCPAPPLRARPGRAGRRRPAGGGRRPGDCADAPVEIIQTPSPGKRPLDGRGGRDGRNREASCAMMRKRGRGKT